MAKRIMAKRIITPANPCNVKAFYYWDEEDEMREAFDACEAEGFAKAFWMPYREEGMELLPYLGKKFKMVERVIKEECEVFALKWRIKFEDGTEIIARPENVVPSVMKWYGYNPANPDYSIQTRQPYEEPRVKVSEAIYRSVISAKNEIADLLEDAYENNIRCPEDFFATVMKMAVAKKRIQDRFAMIAVAVTGTCRESFGWNFNMPATRDVLSNFKNVRRNLRRKRNLFGFVYDEFEEKGYRLVRVC